MTAKKSRTIGEFEEWLERRGRGASRAQYARIARRYQSDPEDIEGLIVDEDYSPLYRRHVAAVLKSWATFSGNGDLLVRLSDTRLAPGVPMGQREPLPREDWIAVRAAIERSPGLSEPLRLVCGLIALRGIRAGDVLRLRRIDLRNAIKTNTLSYKAKGGRWQHYRAKPLRHFLNGLNDLRWGTRKTVAELVSPTADSAGRAVRRAFDALADELGMPREDLYAHRFRHTYATLFLQELEGDPEAVFKLQEQMGWAQLETAASYLRRSRREELDEAEDRLLGSD